MTVSVWDAVEWLVVTPHLALLAAGAGIACWARVASLRPPGRAGDARRTRRDLDDDELAYLAGGSRRVVEVAVARLVRTGALEIRPRARVRPRPDARPDSRATTPPSLAARILYHAAHEGSLSRILTVHRDDPEVTAVRHRLATAGLRGAPDAAPQRRRARRWVAALVGTAAAGCVLIFAGLLVGIARNGAPPVSFGVFTLALVVVILLRVLAGTVDPAPEPRYRTPAGIRALRDARRAPPGSSRDRRVALDGLSAAREMPLGWRRSWWRSRDVLGRLVPLVPLAVATVVIVGIVRVLLPLS